jgi:hypothetical protein
MIHHRDYVPLVFFDDYSDHLKVFFDDYGIHSQIAIAVCPSEAPFPRLLGPVGEAS